MQPSEVGCPGGIKPLSGSSDESDYLGMSTHTLGRFTLSLLGALFGFVVGAIVAVNVVIFTGMDEGYESTIPEIFGENAAVGVITVLILAAGPVLGVLVARKLGRNQDPH